MAGNPHLWSTTAATNSTSDPDINWAEGQLPSTVNNSSRAVMAGVAGYVKDRNGTLTSGGSANAYTLTSNIGHTALTTGIEVEFTASFTNTGAATLNLNGLGAKAIRIASASDDSALIAGQITSGGKYRCRYSSTANSAAGAWLLLTASSVGHMALNGDVVLTHPLTPTPDNHPSTNITLGVFAGASLAPIHSTQYLTLLGFEAGASLTTQDHITAIGAWALASYNAATTGNAITAIGLDCMRSLTAGVGNVGIGEHAITAALDVSFCTAVGVNAMNNAGGTYNTFIGYGAGLGAVSPSQLTGEGNTGVGHSSLNVIAGAANNNTALGRYALAAVTTGSGNVGIGYLAGQTLTTGNNNIVISRNSPISDVPTASTSDYLNIGDAIKGPLAGGLDIKGTPTNGSASAGCIGEHQIGTLAFASRTALTTATAKSVTSVLLEPGDYDVEANAFYSPSGTTNITFLNATISLVDNTVGTGEDRTSQTGYPSAGTVPSAITTLSTPRARISLAVQTRVYLVALATFTVSTLDVYGMIQARRVF